MSKKQKHLFRIIFTSILIALNIVLERFLAYSVWNQSISFSFVPVAFAAAFFGAPYAVAVGALGDILGAILFPIGPYFPGFTFTNTLTALCTALFIYKNATILKISISVIINKIIGSLVLNTIWISLLYRGGINAFGAVFITRLPQAGIMTVIEILTLTFLFSNKRKIRTSLKNML